MTSGVLLTKEVGLWTLDRVPWTPFPFLKDWTTVHSATTTTSTPAYSLPPLKRQASAGIPGGTPCCPDARYCSSTLSRTGAWPTCPQYAPPWNQSENAATSLGVSMRYP